MTKRERWAVQLIKRWLHEIDDASVMDDLATHVAERLVELGQVNFNVGSWTDEARRRRSRDKWRRTILPSIVERITDQDLLRRVQHVARRRLRQLRQEKHHHDDSNNRRATKRRR